MDLPNKHEGCPPSKRLAKGFGQAENLGCCDLAVAPAKEPEASPCYRYAAYASRFRTALRASAKTATRYLAYTSDVGESFRPVVPLIIVRLGYAISWLYVITEVSYTSWKQKMRQEGRFYPGLTPWKKAPPPDPRAPAFASDERDWRVVGVKEMVFQSVASMALPALTIHTVVAHSGFMYKKFKNCNLRKYGPVANGLAIVPFLPFFYDKPIEEAVEWLTEKAENLYENVTKRDK